MSATDKAYKKARRLRRELTLPEKLLWVRLKGTDLHFRKQHPIGPYILDFYCSRAKLAIEVDGMSHEMANRPQSDDMRDSWLRLRNVQTLRIPASDVARSPNQVIEWIVNKCEERVGPLHQPAAGPPPRSGEDA